MRSLGHVDSMVNGEPSGVIVCTPSNDLGHLEFGFSPQELADLPAGLIVALMFFYTRPDSVCQDLQ